MSLLRQGQDPTVVDTDWKPLDPTHLRSECLKSHRGVSLATDEQSVIANMLQESR